MVCLVLQLPPFLAPPQGARRRSVKLVGHGGVAPRLHPSRRVYSPRSQIINHHHHSGTQGRFTPTRRTGPVPDRARSSLDARYPIGAVLDSAAPIQGPQAIGGCGYWRRCLASLSHEQTPFHLSSHYGNSAESGKRLAIIIMVFRSLGVGCTLYGWRRSWEKPEIKHIFGRCNVFQDKRPCRRDIWN